MGSKPEPARKMTMEDIFPLKCLRAISEEGLAAKNRGQDPLDIVKRFEEIIEPYMDEINEITGQENDLTYLAYAASFACSQTLQRRQ